MSLSPASNGPVQGNKTETSRSELAKPPKPPKTKISLIERFLGEKTTGKVSTEHEVLKRINPSGNSPSTTHFTEAATTSLREELSKEDRQKILADTNESQKKIKEKEAENYFLQKEISEKEMLVKQCEEKARELKKLSEELDKQADELEKQAEELTRKGEELGNKAEELKKQAEEAKKRATEFTEQLKIETANLEDKKADYKKALENREKSIQAFGTTLVTVMKSVFAYSMREIINVKDVKERSALLKDLNRTIYDKYIHDVDFFSLDLKSKKVILNDSQVIIDLILDRKPTEAKCDLSIFGTIQDGQIPKLARFLEESVIAGNIKDAAITVVLNLSHSDIEALASLKLQKVDLFLNPDSARKLKAITI